MSLLIYTLKSLSLIVLSPFFLSILLILSVIFYIKNRKTSQMQKKIYGESINSPLELTLSQFALGILAGIILGIITSFLGITFKENSGIQILFVISIIFMVMNPRLACYSYGGAVLGIGSLIYTHIITKGTINGPFDIDIVSLITFIGILHIVEGMLVIIDGSKASIPVFARKKNIVYGGYALNRYWFLPMNVLIFIKSNTIASIAASNISTPKWWPLVYGPETLKLLASCTLIAMTFYGVFNYSGLTFTKNKREKVREEGILILLYGIVIAVFAQFARLGVWCEVLVLIAMPILHEVTKKLLKYREKKHKPIFYSFPGRVCVIEVIPNSLAYKAGVRPGDFIRSINGQIVKSEKEIYSMKDAIINELNLAIIKKNKEINIYIERNKNKGLGILVVPVSKLDNRN